MTQELIDRAHDLMWNATRYHNANKTEECNRGIVPDLVAALEAAQAQLEDWKASQHYSYIGRDGKRITARELEAQLEAAQAREAQIAAMIAEAVAKEREAIAGMIETHAYTVSGKGRFLEPSTRAKYDQHHATIAATIRARGQE